MRLSFLLFCCLYGICWTSDNYCIYQPRSVRVREGESVTIPCSYTYPERYRRKAQILWGERNGSSCYNIKKPITDGSGNILEEYKERMSTVTHPDNRTASLIIRGWKPSDGTTFCCEVTIYPTINITVHKPFTWSDTFGTSLTFSDGVWVSQVEELMAIPGEKLIIPCHYSLKTLGEAQHVTWYTGESKLCDYNVKTIYSWKTTRSGDVYPYSLVNFPEDVSLRIYSVQGDKYQHYCCSVTTRNKTIQSRYGTGLTITGVRSKRNNVSEDVETSDSPEKTPLSLEERPGSEIPTKDTQRDGGAESKEGAKERGMESETTEEENILYSELNTRKLQHTSPAPYQDKKEEIVYAAVIRPGSDSTEITKMCPTTGAPALQNRCSETSIKVIKAICNNGHD
ncbi:uncharacterized protein [Dendropsophus ebraccatus]|uniref:uncharacterized protein n=1 Tax=Dendropsophus ebraccatus TaxID=150705 RepID=UPI003831D98B